MQLCVCGREAAWLTDEIKVRQSNRPTAALWRKPNGTGSDASRGNNFVWQIDYDRWPCSLTVSNRRIVGGVPML
jgi:hypothetical protein